MSDIDLAEAVEAAARDRAERQNGRGSWATADGYVRYAWLEGVYREVNAAAPHIERQVREQVAREIETEAARRRRDADEYAAARGGTRDPHQDSIRAGFSLAASIARGDS